MTDGEESGSTVRWWKRLGRRILQFLPHLSAEDRHAALDALMVRPSGVVVRRYTILLGLSVIVASVGLLQNSAAASSERC